MQLLVKPEMWWNTGHECHWNLNIELELEPAMEGVNDGLSRTTFHQCYTACAICTASTKGAFLDVTPASCRLHVCMEPGMVEPP